MPSVQLRPATLNDAKFLYDLRMDPSVRAVSFQQHPISWDTHRTWLANKLQKTSSIIWIAESAQQAIGQVRLDALTTNPHTAEIHMAIVPAQRNRGQGLAVLMLACKKATQDLALHTLIAHIKPDNVASLRLFSKAGFVLHSPNSSATQHTLKWSHVQ